jgi:hypothetical protein
MLTQGLAINTSYCAVGFIVCLSLFLISMRLAKNLIEKQLNTHMPIMKTMHTKHALVTSLELLTTIPCLLVFIATSLFVTSPFILGGTLAMIFIFIDHAFKYSVPLETWIN